MTRQLANGRVNLFGDCKGIVDAVSASQQRCLAPTRLYAGLFRTVNAKYTNSEVATISWVKAHTADGAMDEDLSKEVRANRAVDAAAKAGLQLQPVAPRTVVEEADALVSNLRLVYRLAASLLWLWPRLPDGLVRVKPRNGAPVLVPAMPTLLHK